AAVVGLGHDWRCFLQRTGVSVHSGSSRAPASTAWRAGPAMLYHGGDEGRDGSGRMRTGLMVAAAVAGLLASSGLAQALDPGLGVTANRAMALQLYLAAAKLGHLDAMRAIGMAYESGNGVERSIPNALSWYRRAADHGDNVSFNRARRLALAMNGDGGLSRFDAAFVDLQRAAQLRA